MKNTPIKTDLNTSKRIARLKIAQHKAKDPDMKRIWGNKIDYLKGYKHYGDNPEWSKHWSEVFRKMK
jgi:hypothetical protein